MLKKVKLETNAIDYIKGELSQGGKFSDHLLGLSFEQGEVTTFIPEGADLNLLIEDYGESITYLTGVPVLKDFELEIINLIQNFLRSGDHRMVVFETFWDLDRHFKPEIPWFSVNQQKCIVIDSNQNDAGLITMCMNEANAYPTIYLFIIAPNVPSLHQEASDALLSTLSTGTQSVVVGAFDGEGYLIWTR